MDDTSDGGIATNQMACAAQDAASAARILDLLPGLVARVDRDLRYTYANATYQRWAGFPPSTLIGRDCRDVAGEANYPAIARELARALAGETVTYEYTLFAGDRARRVQGSYAPDHDAQGRITGVVVLAIDIGQRIDLQARIAETEAMFDDAFRSAPIGMAVVDVDGRLIRANDAFASMLGYAGEALVGIDFRDITHPDDIDLDYKLFEQVLQGRRNGYRIEKRYLRKGGGLVDAVLSVSVVRDAQGAAMRFVSQIEDITDRRVAERALLKSNARLSLAMEATRGGFWHMDIATGSFETSAQLTRMISGGNAMPIDFDGYFGRIDITDRAAAGLDPLREGRIDRGSAEYRLETSAGRRWMRCDRLLIRGPDGRPEEIVGVAIDITEQRERQTRLEDQAHSDALTGILNRRGLDRAIETLPQAAAIGVLLIDLDGFKRVNDRYGHKSGDRVLIEAAARLRDLARREDMVARLGGDEFVLVLPDADERALTSIAMRITAALNLPFWLDGASVTVGGSIGLSLAKADERSFAAMLEAADQALYEVKSAGRGSWRLAS
jgi:diguanylate cyclase (GGDEF)-like protein/PAS domain S-box-containing protein